MGRLWSRSRWLVGREARPFGSRLFFDANGARDSARALLRPELPIDTEPRYMAP